MVNLNLPIIGPAALSLAHKRALGRRCKSLATLDFGPPGSGKTHINDLFALELTGGQEHSIERVNGQSVTVELVREWRKRACVGNLFSKWTVKRIDELDCASPAARNELLSLIDYLPAHYAVLATTNNYESLRGDNSRRIESRFKTNPVNGPSEEEAVAYLVGNMDLPIDVARKIAECARPDGELLDDLGVNMRLCVEDAENWLAVQDTHHLAAA
jgi:hypothetical protein